MTEITMEIKLDATTRQRLQALGELRDRSVHWLVVAAIRRYLDEEEEYERRKREDTEEWEDYLRPGNAIPGEKVTAWLKEMVAQRNYVEWHD